MTNEEIIEKRNDPVGGEKHSHPSFGMLSFVVKCNMSRKGSV